MHRLEIDFRGCTLSLLPTRLIYYLHIHTSVLLQHCPSYMMLFTFFMSSPDIRSVCRSTIFVCSNLHSIQCVVGLPTLIPRLPALFCMIIYILSSQLHYLHIGPHQSAHVIYPATSFLTFSVSTSTTIMNKNGLSGNTWCYPTTSMMLLPAVVRILIPWQRSK